MNITINNLKTGHAVAASIGGEIYVYDPQRFNLSKDLDPNETGKVYWVDGQGVVDYEHPMDVKRKDLHPKFRRINNVVLYSKPLPAVVSVRVHLSDNADWKPYVYKWFTRTNVSNFTRDNGTGSGDIKVEDAYAFSLACGVEIAEDYLKPSWSTIRKIIETSINEFHVDNLTIPFSLHKRFDRSVLDGLQDVWDEVVNGGDTEKIKQYFSVIITQLKYPNERIVKHMGDFESSHVTSLKAKIVREIGSLINDGGETYRLFEIVSEAFDQWYAEPH